jgi:hydrogenase maturation protease
MSDPGNGRALVIGLGNPIMTDDGLGLAALERLRERCSLPESVRLVDGGTWGMNLLPLIEEADHVVFLDAIDAGRPAGATVVVERDELPRLFALKLSAHQIDLREVLAVAEWRGTLPSHLVAIGLQPGRVEMGSRLSPELECRLDEVVTLLLNRLEQWGVVTRHRAPASAQV